jgi:predicted membrane protein
MLFNGIIPLFNDFRFYEGSLIQYIYDKLLILKRIRMETLSVEFVKRKRVKKIVFGILVFAAGITLLGFNTGYLPKDLKHIVFSWQSLLVAIGFINIFDKKSWPFGLVLMLVGGVYLTSITQQLPFDFHAIFWPVLLIGAGLMIVLKRTFGWKTRKECNGKRWKTDTATSYLSEGKINESNVFGGSKRVIMEEQFRGGRIENVFGGSELDFRSSKLAEGEHILEITSVFGGITMIVPSDWNIAIEMENVMGGFVDKRRTIQTNITNAPKLIIKGSSVFGGGEIKSY